MGSQSSALVARRDFGGLPVRGIPRRAGRGSRVPSPRPRRAASARGSRRRRRPRCSLRRWSSRIIYRTLFKEFPLRRKDRPLRIPRWGGSVSAWPRPGAHHFRTHPSAVMGKPLRWPGEGQGRVQNEGRLPTTIPNQTGAHVGAAPSSSTSMDISCTTTTRLDRCSSGNTVAATVDGGRTGPQPKPRHFTTVNLNRYSTGTPVR